MLEILRVQYTKQPTREYSNLQYAFIMMSVGVSPYTLEPG